MMSDLLVNKNNMVLNLYNKQQFFFNLLLVNLVVGIVRILQWLSIQPERLGFIAKYIGYDLFVMQLICVLMIVVFKAAFASRNQVIKIFTFAFYSIGGPVLLLIVGNLLKSIIWTEGILYKINQKTILEAINYMATYFVIHGGIFYLTHYRNNYQKQKEETQKIESLAKDTQLKMLRYQINPHFLFNILNSLHALVDENTNTAKKLIVSISEYYRSVLDKQIQKNTIEQEVDLARKYFEIQKIRFEDSLEYTIELDDEAGSIEIPTFVIHLLIENAIKYGSKRDGQKLIIKLIVKISKKNLSVIVKNSGRIKTPPNQVPAKNNGTQSGIENIKKRLQLFFKDDVYFSLTEEEGNWVIARIDIQNFSNE